LYFNILICKLKTFKGDKYNFKVVSILGDNYNLGVKHGETVTPLTASPFPCKFFTNHILKIKQNY